jgi:hypothetical protein
MFNESTWMPSLITEGNSHKKNSFWLIQISVYSIYQNLGFSTDGLTFRAIMKALLYYSFYVLSAQRMNTPLTHLSIWQIYKLWRKYHLFNFSHFLIALAVFWNTQVANDILTYYLHAWGMYNWNVYVGADLWRYCNKCVKSTQAFTVLLVHNLAGPDCKEFFGVLPKPLSCSLLYMASKCECMVYEG